ncbi:MAG: TIGR04282 family arsenosugar biosynthesis glycosyltransferase [Bacillota bacterium]
MTAALAIFSKVPLPGSTKSRLEGRLTPEECALFHRACLLDLHGVVRNTGLKVYLYYTGGNRDDFYRFTGPVPPGFEALESLELDSFNFRPQQGSNLGERLDYAVEELLQSHRQVIIIGSDLPYLTAELFLSARHALDTVDLVAGPAEDGGYYLLGLKRSHPGLFRNIDWGTGLVLQQTLAVAHQGNLSVTMLPVQRDIDTWEDLVAFVGLGTQRLELQKLLAYRLASYFTKNATRVRQECDKRDGSLSHYPENAMSRNSPDKVFRDKCGPFSLSHYSGGSEEQEISG